MTLTDQQFESVLLRLESGESFASVEADFPALQEDLGALQDLQDFFAAQRLQARPNPAGLKSVLHQLKAFDDVASDDDIGWGSFFTSLSRNFAVALPALLVLGTGGYVWQQQTRSLTADTLIAAETIKVAQKPPMDMAALAESISAEFASNMAEFETTQDELEPFYEEQLFSFEPTNVL